LLAPSHLCPHAPLALHFTSRGAPSTLPPGLQCCLERLDLELWDITREEHPPPAAHWSSAVRWVGVGVGDEHRCADNCLNYIFAPRANERQQKARWRTSFLSTFFASRPLGGAVTNWRMDSHPPASRRTLPYFVLPQKKGPAFWLRDTVSIRWGTIMLLSCS
jgi:hypothetical protein